MLTDKNKEQFEKWYKEYAKNKSTEFYTYPIAVNFHTYTPFEMQIGVYLAYYDSLGIYIHIDWSIEVDWMYNVEIKEVGFGIGGYKTRNEAYKEAFKEADKLINKEL